MRRYRRVVEVPADGVGRFSLLPPASGEAVEARLASVEQWLQRYGVLTREAIAVEAREGGFGAVYPLLRALEERGQVRRGYFVEALGALQFADPAAVDHLRASKEGGPDGGAFLLAAADPANPFGATLPWPAWCEGQGERRAKQHLLIADGLLLALFFQNGARALVGPVAGRGRPGEEASVVDEGSRLRAGAVAVLNWMRRRGFRIIGHETTDAPLNQGPLAAPLREAGLTPSGPGFRL